MRFSEHLDYLAISPGGPIDVVHPCKAPCNSGLEAPVIFALVAAGASVAGTTANVIQTRNAAKQAELNAEAEAKALNQEARRQQMEFEENQRRMAKQQKAFRSAQLARMADSGFFTGTGTTLELEADTWAQQQRELNDAQYVQAIGKQQLQYRAGTALEMGRQQASQLRGQIAGQIFQGVGQVAQIGMGAAKGGGSPDTGGGRPGGINLDTGPGGT